MSTKITLNELQGKTLFPVTDYIVSKWYKGSIIGNITVIIPSNATANEVADIINHAVRPFMPDTVTQHRDGECRMTPRHIHTLGEGYFVPGEQHDLIVLGDVGDKPSDKKPGDSSQNS